MAAAIAVSVSTGVMKPVLDKLATLMGDEFSKMKNLRKEVKFLSDELTSMKDVLESLADVDELDPQTKKWRNKVRDMSYDIENIIDDFKRKIGEKNEKDGLIMKTIRLLKTSRARHQIASQIEGIKKLVCETSKRRKRYKVVIPPSNETIDPRVATLYKDAASLVGVKEPTDELVNWLNDEETQLKVVSIVGFGGLGKTTLANEVYRQYKEGFDCRAFVPVTQKPNIPKLIHSLLSELGSELSSHDCEVNVLLNRLREYLQKKRYLIVIDDLWDTSSWDIIKNAFPENGFGSRVITTTRIHDVAKACCSHRRDYILKMKPLSNEDSRRLFFGRIFNSEEACPCELRDVFNEILKKCDGMPLAIISISGMLASEGFNQEEWEHLRNSLGSGTSLTLEGMRKILDLSYKNLPPHLRTCLLYLGMYPEDFEIQRQHLELQWIAESFISKENGQDVEKVARSYFNELVNRSLIQPIDFDNCGLVTHCKVHDMMRDLILCKCAEENFLTIVDDPQAITKLDYKVRRLSLHLDDPINGTMLSGNISLSEVRTFMIFGDCRSMPPLSLFKFLRVLHIRNFGILMDGVDLTGLSNMYQLRYLAVDYWVPIVLPTQIRGLRHLETLDADFNMNIPSDIFHLPCLMFLNVNSGGPQLPDGIGSMKSLRYIENFDLMNSSLDNIEGLGELTRLKTLAVHDSSYAAEDKRRSMDALCSSLGKICTSLEYLGLNIKGCIDVLMDLSPPPRRLERLCMGDSSHNTHYGLIKNWREEMDGCTFISRVPNWIGELSNLKELKINVLKADVGILAELPALTRLKLYIREIVRETIVIYARAFPVLKWFSLRLSSPSYLTFQAGAMPKLQYLRLEFHANEREQNGPGPAGIHHLSALEEFSAEISASPNMAMVKNVHATEFKAAVHALGSALGMHPSHPHVDIRHKSIGNNWLFLPSDYSGVCYYYFPIRFDGLEESSESN